MISALVELTATVTTLQDIKKTDHELYAKLESKPSLTLDEINHAAVQKIFKEAPKAPAKRKPFKSELEELEDGAYDKYFKQVTTD